MPFITHILKCIFLFTYYKGTNQLYKQQFEFDCYTLVQLTKTAKIRFYRNFSIFQLLSYMCIVHLQISLWQGKMHLNAFSKYARDVWNRINDRKKERLNLFFSQWNRNSQNFKLLQRFQFNFTRSVKMKGKFPSIRISSKIGGKLIFSRQTKMALQKSPLPLIHIKWDYPK